MVQVMSDAAFKTWFRQKEPGLVAKGFNPNVDAGSTVPSVRDAKWVAGDAYRAGGQLAAQHALDELVKEVGLLRKPGNNHAAHSNGETSLGTRVGQMSGTGVRRLARA